MAIVGNLYKLEKYFINNELSSLFNYLKNVVNNESNLHQYLYSLPIGTFEKHVFEKNILIFFQVDYTKTIDKCFIESHKKYVDFQLLIDGTEEMGYIDIDKLQIDVPYSIERDLITYHMQNNYSKFLLESQDIAIFFPDDGHIGLAMHKKKSLIRKIVVKVPISLLESID